MGKKRKPTATPPGESGAKQPFNTGLSGLAALRDALPEGEQAPAEEESTPTAPLSDGEAWLRRKLVVGHERKGRGGKTVTLLQASFDGDDPPRVARELARAFGCTARAEEGTIVLGGDQRERLAAWLEQRGARSVVVAR